MEYETRTSKIVVTRKGEPIFEEFATSIEIADEAAGKFSATGYNGNLKNAGTFLAPYHDLIRKVPTALRTEVTKLGNDIRSGKVSAK